MTPNQEKFLEVLFTEAKGDYKIARELAGYSPTTSIKSITDSIKKEIAEATREYLALLGPKAVGKLEFILDNPTELGVDNILKATNSILDRAGFKDKDTQVDTPNYIFILPEKNKDEE